MLFKKISYWELDLADARFVSSGIVLQDFYFPLELETHLEDIALSHGQKAFSTRAKWRVYKISWRIIGMTPEKRNMALKILENTIRPSWILGENDTKRLEWENFLWEKFWTLARVYEAITYTHNPQDPIVEFSFSLFAEFSEYFSIKENSIELDPNNTLWFGKFSGDTNGIHLWFLPTGGHALSGSIIENKWNFEAWVKIFDFSWIENNFYINLSNGLKYWVSWRAENRSIDTTKKPTEILDYWQISLAERLPHSTGFLLSPGTNIIASGNGKEYTKWQIIISWYDTYI